MRNHKREECLTFLTPDETTNATLSPFERLPHDVVWKIIEYTPESAFNLRRTSRMLKTFADEYTMLRSPTGQIIKELRICGSSERFKQGDLSSRIYISMYVPKHLAKEFGNRIFCASFLNLINKIEVGTCKTMKVFRLNCYYIRTGNESLIEFVRFCMGDRIGRVALSKCCDPASLDFVSKLLDGVQLDHLRIAFSTLTDDVVNHLVQNITINKLTLEVKKVSSVDPGRILLGLSSHISFIHIKQLCVERIESNSRYFFGAHDVDWAPIFVEMFSGKLRKLCVDNFSFPEYLNLKSAELIRERLPNLEKKIWFEASCDQYPEGLNYQINGYSVKADKIDEVDRFLMIKHLSRKGERF